MKNYSLAAILGGAILSVASASASTTTFQFNTDSATITNGGAYGDKIVFSESTGVSATIYGYSNATSSSTTGTTFQTGQIGQSTGTATVTPVGGGSATIPLGLTLCNQKEGLNCSSPQHQVDNNMGYDFVLIEFNTSVNLSSLTLSTYQGNGSNDSQDFEYITGSGAFPVINPNSTTVASLMGSATQVSCATAGFNTSALHNCDTGASNTYTPSGPTGGSFGGNGVTWVMIGAADPYASGSNDYFKISDLVVSNNTVVGTPEPATFGLIGLALAGLGIAGRKFKSSRS